MHQFGKKIMQTHPFYLEWINPWDKFENLKRSITEKNSHEFSLDNRSFYYCIIHGEMPGYGLYIFAETEADLTWFKLKYY